MSGRIRSVILDLALARGRGRSFCPSEVARSVAEDWRGLMPEVRSVAATMPEILAMHMRLSKATRVLIRAPMPLVSRTTSNCSLEG